MAYTKFSNHYNWSTGDEVTATRLNYNADGPQSEFEDRMEASLLNGVVSGMACSIDGTSIAVASGEGYCEGKRYSGSGSVSFVGQSADTYYVYVDPTDDATPYSIKTAAPSTGELTLASVVWSGSALTSPIDRREWGTVPWDVGQFVKGSVTTGVIGYYIVPFDIWLEDVKVSVRSAPTGSSVIVDVHAGSAGATPSTVFTTTAYRPTIATSDAAYSVKTNTGYVEVNRKLSAGNIIEVYVDQTDTSSAAADITFGIRGRIYGKSA